MHPRPRPENDGHRAPIGLTDLDRGPALHSIVPAYLTPVDHPWLRALLDERERFVGCKRGVWDERVAEGLPMAPPAVKLRTALTVLDRLVKDRSVNALSARTIRALVFRAAAAEPTRELALSYAAKALSLAEDAIMEGLFADLPSERELMPLREPLGPAELALLCNAELIASLMARALRVRIEAHGNVRAVVRHAKLMGLLCHLAPTCSKEGVLLEISGPFSLFRHTRVYGRALASLVPRLVWCNTYRLEAECIVAGGSRAARLVVRAGDPVLPARELPAFDSKVEERFARAFARIAPGWDVVREPVALAVGEALIFPDFELHQRATGKRWLLEIVGYWTPEYVAKKLKTLREARVEHLIVCIDDERACNDDPLDLDAHVVRFRRRVDPLRVLEVVDADAARAAQLREAKRPKGKRAAPRRESAK